MNSSPAPRHFIDGPHLWQWRQTAMAQAIAHHIDPAEVDWLLQAVSNLDRLTLRLGEVRTRDRIALTLSAADLDSRWQQRVEAKVPIQYLAGQTQWRHFTLTVSPAVLIPRPETELLIDCALAATAAHPTLRTGHWVDLGTGSGAIALGLADAFPDAVVHGVDCSAEAIAIAQHNAQRNGLLSAEASPQRLQFHHGQWFSPFHGFPQRFNGVVSNPPYIPSATVPTLQVEVAAHEPHLALDGGEDGLDCVRTIVHTAPDYLAPHGLLLLELMAGQADGVAAMLNHHDAYDAVQIHADLAGVPRFVEAKRCG